MDDREELRTSGRASDVGPGERCLHEQCPWYFCRMPVTDLTQLIGAALGLGATLFAVPGLLQAMGTGGRARGKALMTWVASLRGRHHVVVHTDTIGVNSWVGAATGRSGVGFPPGATPDERFEILRQYSETTREILHTGLAESAVEIKQVRSDLELATREHGALLAETRRTVALQGNAASLRQLSWVPLIAAGAVLGAAPEVVADGTWVGWCIRIGGLIGVAAGLTWVIRAAPLNEDLGEAPGA